MMKPQPPYEHCWHDENGDDDKLCISHPNKKILGIFGMNVNAAPRCADRRYDRFDLPYR